MQVAFQHKISTRLAKLTVAIAFVVGIFLSSIQIYLDYQDQGYSLDSSIDQMLTVSLGSATRSVHTLDTNLAEEVVNGLMHYPFIQRIRLADDLGAELYSVERPSDAQSSTLWLTEWLVTENKPYIKKLFIDPNNPSSFGLLELKVDWDQALQPFYSRLINTLAGGVIRNFILALCLFYLFYSLLAAPMNKMADRLRRVDSSHPEGTRMAPEWAERSDELGAIAKAINQFLETVEGNILRRDLAENQLAESVRQTRQIIDNVPHMVFARDRDGNFLFLNQSVSFFYKLPVDELEGTCHYHLHDSIQPGEANEIREADLKVLEDGEPLFIPDHSYTDSTGRLHYFQTSLVPFTYFGVNAVLGVAVDITERKLAEEKVIELAFYDGLTGLPNRNLLLDRLDLEMKRAERHDTLGALLFIDLDNFKAVNDSFGHSVGDEVLQHVAAQLQAGVRAVDTVARLGGDEFLVIIPDLPADINAAREVSKQVAEILSHNIAKPLSIKGSEWSASASIGIAMYPVECNSVSEILRYADTAMYEAKKQGRSQFVFFESDMASRVEQAYSLENELRHAVNRNEFFLVLQPQLSVQSNQIKGAEVLIRWRHPERGVVPPFEFIPILESSGLIQEVGRWLIRESCELIKEWQLKGLWEEGAWLSVNVSPNQFYDLNFVSDVLTALKYTGVAPESLELEITEGIVIGDVDSTIGKLDELRSHGIRIAMDDFGTGYSSLSYLKKIPLDVLKIDQSFVRDLTTDKTDRAIVDTILSMSDFLDLEVVAEGVETQEHHDFFKQTRCHRYQGYLYSPPVESSRFEQFLTEKLANKVEAGQV